MLAALSLSLIFGVQLQEEVSAARVARKHITTGPLNSILIEENCTEQESKESEHETMDCDADTYGFSLHRADWDSPRWQYELTLPSKQKIPVILRRFAKIGHDEDGFRFNVGSGNCFAFATHQKRQTPGSGGGKKSPVDRPYDVNQRTFLKAMKMEGAIFLGRDLSQIKVPFESVDPSKKYYFVAGLLKWEEYHFWGLFDNGWWNKPSKVGKVYGANIKLENSCPTTSMFNRLTMTHGGPKKYRQKEGGYFLFPCKKHCDAKEAPESSDEDKGPR